jgi:hypothetical protein
LRNDGKTELQHYVPKVLLRAHANNPGCARGSEQVWCFDKRDGRVFSPNIRGVASGNGFYDLTLGTEVLSLEPLITQIEDRAAPVIQRIVSKRSLTGLTDADRKNLAVFCAVQFVRTQATRDEFQSAMDGMRVALAARSIDASQLREMKPLTPDQQKLMEFKTMLEAHDAYASDFLSKHWYLMAATEDDPFYLGDNPIVRENESHSPEQTGLGLRCPGISFSLPLSPTLCLGIIDPGEIKKLRVTYQKARRMRDRRVKRDTKLKRKGRFETSSPAETMTIDIDNFYQENIRDLVNGGLVICDAGAIRRVNFLQTAFASRWVISSRNDFTLAKEVVSADERFRRSPTFIVK